MVDTSSLGNFQSTCQADPTRISYGTHYSEVKYAAEPSPTRTRMESKIRVEKRELTYSDYGVVVQCTYAKSMEA